MFNGTSPSEVKPSRDAEPGRKPSHLSLIDLATNSDKERLFSGGNSLVLKDTTAHPRLQCLTVNLEAHPACDGPRGKGVEDAPVASFVLQGDPVKGDGRSLQPAVCEAHVAVIVLCYLLAIDGTVSCYVAFGPIYFLLPSHLYHVLICGQLARESHVPACLDRLHLPVCHLHGAWGEAGLCSAPLTTPADTPCLSPHPAAKEKPGT